ncbi:MAG: YMGG-like glycine zipper-containing protein [Pseudomonadota bacterium]
MKRIMTILAAGGLALAAQTASAGSLPGAAAFKDHAASSAIVHVHKKRCKFWDSDGYTYKDHCPHGVKKGDRKKRAGIGAGVGAATGAIIGGIFGGGRGAAIGAGAGAAAGALGGAASVRKCWYRDEYGRKVRIRCRQ